MKQQSFFARLIGRCRDNTRFGTVFTAVAIAVIVVLNTVIFGLATKYSWYFRTDEVLEHSIGHGTDKYLGEVADKGDVRIIFCDAPDALAGDQVYNLVWQTARQFDARYDFVEVKNINIFTDPSDVEKYKYETDKEGNFVLDENGNRKKINAISKSTVIFEGIKTKDFVVLPMQSFFVLDEESTITAYNGEEVIAAMIHRVQTPDTRPTAYFTTSHGETYSTTFMNKLLCAGYALTTVDLLSETVEYKKGDILIISNPRYDFVRGNTANGIIGELDRIDRFLAAGGGVVAMLDPLVTNTVKLEEFLTGWGITIDRAKTEVSNRDTVMVRDPSNSVTTDGYALISSVGEAGAAKDFADKMKEIDAGRVIISRASPITLTAREGKTLTSLLTSSATAECHADGKVVDKEGSYTLAAISRDNAGGGAVFAVSSVYLTAEDALTTNEYGNRDMLYLVVGHMSDMSVPTGGTYLLFEETSIEDLTMWEARLWTALLAVVLPLSVVACGVVILVKRRNR